MRRGCLRRSLRGRRGRRKRRGEGGTGSGTVRGMEMDAGGAMGMTTALATIDETTTAGPTSKGGGTMTVTMSLTGAKRRNAGGANVTMKTATTTVSDRTDTTAGERSTEKEKKSETGGVEEVTDSIRAIRSYIVGSAH